MANFDFDTTWHIDAPINIVFDTLTDSLHWPDWWPGLIDVQPLATGDDRGIGRTQRFTWKSRLGYSLRFTICIVRVHEPSLIVGAASGDVAGLGSWKLQQAGQGTRVGYCWQVRTARPWLSLFSHVARPLVVWNHQAMMSDGRLGLVRYLDELGLMSAGDIPRLEP
ncbi:SRPBCC family protein [Billgrantia kenyensis]|uniref:Polyketide cyclase n=1 Tax=Billgrantia kenyensis TaxID=321266 RepID=A0A7V9W495_9GAMM|nr:SRPBCC family protein [Halomonas kenyensis]MBA2780787.1 SRPBCC family protein [Halomonas kenyensis]MCG6663612.1 polyketide cyclase [Halomonas kenyensis]